MRFASAHSRSPDFAEALAETTTALRRALDGAAPDLLCVFVKHEHEDAFDDLPRRLRAELGARTLVGCTGETVVGGGEEIEEGPGLALWAAVLPATRIVSFHVRFEATSDGVVSTGLPEIDLGDGPAPGALFLLGDPYTTAVDSVVQWVADELPGTPLIGGLASGGQGPGTLRVFLDDRSLSEGAVGLLLCGGPKIVPVVSQGCRPIGTPYVVTAAEQNVVLGLGGVPPLARLKEVLDQSSDRDRQLVRRGLHLGLVVNEYQDRFDRGDFLISNVIEVYPQHGALAVGNRVRVGQTVQFHVRDAESADEDLRELVGAAQAARAGPPQAGLLFSCNGRGTRLFPRPHHDAGTVQSLVGPIPLAGFFAQGELGPVGGRNCLHGFTASLALFE